MGKRTTQFPKNSVISSKGAFEAEANLESIKIMDIDSVKGQAQSDISNLFGADYNPVALFLLSESLSLDILLKITPTISDSITNISLCAYNFKTGSVLDEFSFSFTPGNSNTEKQKLLENAFKSLFETVKSQYTRFGFPFRQGDYGINIITENPDSQYLTELLEKIYAVYPHSEMAKNENLRFQIIMSENKINDVGSMFALASHANEKLNARFSIYLPSLEQDSATAECQVFFPFSHYEKPIVNIVPPVRPQIREFCHVALDVTSDGFDVFDSILTRVFNPLPSVEDKVKANSFSIEELLLPIAFERICHLQSSLASEQDPQVQSGLIGLLDSLYVCSENIAAEDTIIRAWLGYNKGHFLQLAKSYENALFQTTKADSQFMAANNSTGSLLCRLQTARILNQLQEYTRARETFQSALLILSSLPDSVSMAHVVQKMGLLAEIEGDVESAYLFYEKSAQIYENIGALYESAQVYGHLSQLSRKSQHYTKLKEYSSAFLARVKKFQSEPALARAYFQSGLSSMAMDNFEDALDYFRNAADYMEILGDSIGLARVDNNIGLIYQSNSDYENAFLSYNSALQLSVATGDNQNTLSSRLNLGDLAATQQNYSLAENHYEEALKVAHHLDDNHQVAIITYAKGLMHLRAGRLKTGYKEVKAAMALNGGPIRGQAEQEEAFLRKLENLIGDIQDIHEQSQLE